MSAAKQLIAELREAISAEARGGPVDATDVAIDRLEEYLLADEPKPLRITGPAIEAGLSRSEISELAADLEDEISIACPWEGCDSEEFHEAWRLWSLARAELDLGPEGAIARVRYTSSQVEWDSAHDERLECVLCCRPVSAAAVVHADMAASRPSSPSWPRRAP